MTCFAETANGAATSHPTCRFPKEKVSPEETKELKALKREALRGEYVPLEDVAKPLRVKSSRRKWGSEAFQKSGEATCGK